MKNKLSREERRAAYSALSSKEKIQYDGKKLLKILDIVRKIIHVCGIICCLVGIAFFIMGLTHHAQEIQEKTGLVQMEEGSSGFSIVSFIDNEKITLKENTPEGWDEFFISIGVYSVLITVMCVIFMMIAKFLKKIFSQIINSETPFCDENKLPLRRILILLTIVIFLQDQFIGLISGFVFLYLYRLFIYGCELQTESDETL